MKTEETTAYKLIRQRKDGSYGPLFFDAKLRIPFGEWLESKDMGEKKGFAYRPGWHCCFSPNAPHLSIGGRAWVEVKVKDFTTYPRPEHQGGDWILAKNIKFVRKLDESEYGASYEDTKEKE
tara:strand:- start:30014 stop:30379 length:366 start_codon:yes stop_codon:yes gene_type:complete